VGVTDTVMTNPAGAAIVNAVTDPPADARRGPNRRRYLVTVPGNPDDHGGAVQVQREKFGDGMNRRLQRRRVA
jgi:hypothetical protein